jgi:hypothetical protein
MAIPAGITRQHVIAAMEELGPDSSRWPKGRLARHYDVIHPDPAKAWPMPPKLVLSYAAQFLIGRELAPQEFSGGTEANGFLEDLGFKVVDRRTA